MKLNNSPARVNELITFEKQVDDYLGYRIGLRHISGVVEETHLKVISALFINNHTDRHSIGST